MKQTKLNEVVRLHELWANGKPGGVKLELRGVDLRSVDLWRANLRDVDLRRADLRRADLRGADLRGACLQGACLQGAYLQGANLWGVNLTGATLDWQSHNLLSEVLRQAAGHDIAKLSVAGLIKISTHLCWKEFIELNHELQPWVFAVLGKFEGFEKLPWLFYR